MPIVAAPVILFAIGAMICYLLAQPMTRGLFTSAAESVPVVGKYLGKAVLAIEAKFIALFKTYVWAHTATFVHWLVGLATNVADFPREVRLFAAEVADALDHAMTVTVHDIVKAFVNPVRATATAAAAAAADAAADLARLSGSIPGRIENAVDRAVGASITAAHQIANAATAEAERIMGNYAEALVAHALDDVRAVDAELGRLARGLGDLVDPATAARVVAGVTGLAALEALVASQVMPLVRDLTECAPKLRATCQTDMTEWLGLLEGLVVLGAMPSLVELARSAQGAVGDFTDDAAALVGMDGAANVPSHPAGWS